MTTQQKQISAWIALGVALSLGLAACSKGGEQGAQGDPTGEAGAAQSAANEAPAATVEVATVRTGSLTEAMEVTGQLATLKDATLSPKVAAKITQMNVVEGNFVKAGQIIAQQDTSDLRVQMQQSDAAIQAAAAQLRQAEIASSVQPAQTDAQIKTAKAALEAAQARLRALQTGSRPQEIQQAEQQVAAAKASYDWAKTDLENTQRLYEQGALPKAAYDQKLALANAALAQYQSSQKTLSLVKEGPRREDIEAAEQQVRQAEEAYRQAVIGRSQNSLRQQQVEAARAALNQARANRAYVQQQISNSTMRAPFDGYIATRYAEVGTMVSPGVPVARIVSLSKLHFEANVSETLIRELKQGQPVQVTVDAFPNIPFTGALDEIYPLASSDSRDLKVRIILNNPDAKLKPGMFARGRITIRTYANVPLLPKLALLERAGNTRVFVVANEKASERAVRVRASDTSVLYAEGIRPGEVVVIRGQDALSDGQAVRVLDQRVQTSQSR